jgi:hypothetical protein
MKTYLYPNGVTIIGKAWEIRAKLRETAKKCETIQEWINQGKRKK